MRTSYSCAESIGHASDSEELILTIRGHLTTDGYGSMLPFCRNADLTERISMIHGIGAPPALNNSERGE
jgi:hypothetical protein